MLTKLIKRFVLLLRNKENILNNNIIKALCNKISYL